MNLKKQFYMLVCILVAASSCKKDSEGSGADLSASLQPMFIIGNVVAAADVQVSGSGTADEIGVCWSTEPDPTVADGTATADGKGAGTFRIELSGLTPRTTYYVRGYTKSGNEVVYSESQTFRTIGASSLTVNFMKEANPSAELQVTYNRIQRAIDQAMDYMGKYTSADVDFVVRYLNTVQTAEAGAGGWISFGSNAQYQTTSTMMHEMNHVMGTGTTSWWSQDAMPAGVYLLPAANEMVKKITGGERVALTSWVTNPTIHWQPYGMNATGDITEGEWSYVYNALIIEAMRKDGLPLAGTYEP